MQNNAYLRYDHAEFGGARTSRAIGGEIVRFFVFLSVALSKDTYCANDFAMKALQYGHDFGTVGINLPL